MPLAVNSVKRLAVLGDPVGHSLSPAMHTAAFRELGIDDAWSYEAIELTPAGFEAGVRDLMDRGFVGANVTVPHKAAALVIADEASPAAAEIGAANTLIFDDGRIHAENTDAPGLIASLPADPVGARALVLGAGGAGRAAVWALARAGAGVSVWNRTALTADRLALELGVEAVDPVGALPLEGFDLLVNATSVGLQRADQPRAREGADLKALKIEADLLDKRLTVVDLVYGSTETELCRVARHRGARVVDGIEILVRQGAESFRIWTGLEPPITVMSREVKSQQR